MKIKFFYILRALSQKALRRPHIYIYWMGPNRDVTQLIHRVYTDKKEVVLAYDGDVCVCVFIEFIHTHICPHKRFHPSAYLRIYIYWIDSALEALIYRLRISSYVTNKTRAHTTHTIKEESYSHHNRDVPFHSTYEIIRIRSISTYRIYAHSIIRHGGII